MTWLAAALLALGASVEVHAPECEDAWLPSEELLERLRLELRPLGITEVTSGSTDGGASTSVLLRAADCGEVLEVQVQRPGFVEAPPRSVALGALSGVERARVVAYVVAEMVSVKPEAIPPLPEAPRSVPAPPPPGRNRLSASLGAESFPTNRAAPLHVQLGFERDLASWFSLGGGVRGRFGVVSIDAGQVSTGAVTARLAAAFVARAESLRLSVGGQVEVGWLRVGGHTTELGVQPRARDAFAALAGVHARLEVPLLAQVSLVAGVEATAVLAGLDARAAGIPTGGLSGAAVGASAGVSWRLD